MPDIAGVFEDDLPRCAGTAGHQPEFAAALGLADNLPHYTTLQKFSARSKVLEIADAMVRTIGRAAGEPEFAKTSAAMDATGLETTTASAHFQSRSGRTRRKWVKVSTIVLCGSLLPLSLVLDWGLGKRQVPGAGVDDQGQRSHFAGQAVCRRGLRCGVGA